MLLLSPSATPPDEITNFMLTFLSSSAPFHYQGSRTAVRFHFNLPQPCPTFFFPPPPNTTPRRIRTALRRENETLTIEHPLLAE